jgi:hypothetical protein
MLLYVAGWTGHLYVSAPCSCCCYCPVMLDKLSLYLFVRCMALMLQRLPNNGGCFQAVHGSVCYRLLCQRFVLGHGQALCLWDGGWVGFED